MVHAQNPIRDRIQKKGGSAINALNVSTVMEVLDVGKLSESENNQDVSFQAEVRFSRAFPTTASHKIQDLCILNQRMDLLDLDIVRVHLFNEGRLSRRQVLKLIEDSGNILRKEPNLLRVNNKAIVIGDIHGQFYDLVALLHNFDLKSDILVFLGDYVDRGTFSTEVYFYLLLLKTHHPHNICLLRGNHESRKMTEYFTFREECKHKYSLEIYEKCVESFSVLPLAAVILDKVYCSHGGISPGIQTLEEINRIDRFTEVSVGTPMCDILWADPHPEYNNSELDAEFTWNLARRCSYYYTYAGVTSFLERNKLLCMIRGHEVHQKGHMVYQRFNGVPSVVTIFSAPNYCDSYGNLGAILKFDGQKLKIKTFPAQAHPFCLPNNMDGINWSYPFIAEKISEFYLDLLKEPNKIAFDESSSEFEALISSAIERSRNFACSMAIMRSERENLCELEDEESEMVSTTGVNTNHHEDNEFEESKTLDASNEMVPEIEMPKGITMDVAPSLAPHITRYAGEIRLHTILEESNIVVSETGDILRVDTGDKNVDEEESFVCWCFQS